MKHAGWGMVWCGLLAPCIAAPMRGQTTDDARVTGCWQANRPLGPTGGAQPVERDAAFAVLVLRDSGRVALPLVDARERRMWEDRSYWEMRGDSVTLQVFTGLQGWRASLRPTVRHDGMTGRARYLSDAIVRGAAPLRVAVSLTRIECLPEWPSVRSTTRALRRWERGEQLFLPQRVDRRASLPSDVRLPRGVVFMRELRDDERARLDTAGATPTVGRVVLQFVVESDGRADPVGIKVLATDAASDAKRAIELLRSIRFLPALYKGAAVHQLSMFRIDVRR